MASAEDSALHFPLQSPTSSCVPAPLLGVSSSAASSLVASLGEACFWSASTRDCSPACLPAAKRRPASVTQDPPQLWSMTATPASLLAWQTDAWQGGTCHPGLPHHPVHSVTGRQHRQVRGAHLERSCPQRRRWTPAGWRGAKGWPGGVAAKQRLLLVQMGLSQHPC